MKYLKVTYVDAVTGVTCTEAAMASGPKLPDIIGFVRTLDIQSDYPTDTPMLLGTCPDDSDTDVPGVITLLSQEAYQAIYNQELESRQRKLRDQINAERDRRINGGYLFQGHVYQTGGSDRENIAGVFSEALLAVFKGVSAGDYRWRNPEADFRWITQDNSTVRMDAQTMIEFGKAVSQHKEVHIFAAAQLKALDPIPLDFDDDRYWP